MGDLIEFMTWPANQKTFYKITSSAVVFYVKGEGYATVGITDKPGEECSFRGFVFGEDECWIDDNGPAKEVPNIISRNKYGKFWISWHSNKLQFGRSSDSIPLLCKRILHENLQFVTFSIFGTTGAMQWKLFRPPNLSKPLSKKVKGGDMQWLKADGQFPTGALIGGYENEFLYIARAPHRGSLTPGKYVPSKGVCYVSWADYMYHKDKFEVLCGYNCIWVPTCNNRIPVGAVKGGYIEDTHETMYVGRAFQNGHLIPGKVAPSYKACFIPYAGREIAKKVYEILVNPEISMDNLNEYLMPLTNEINIHEEIESNEPF